MSTEPRVNQLIRGNISWLIQCVRIKRGESWLNASSSLNQSRRFSTYWILYCLPSSVNIQYTLGYIYSNFIKYKITPFVSATAIRDTICSDIFGYSVSKGIAVVTGVILYFSTKRYTFHKKILPCHHRYRICLINIFAPCAY